MNKDQVAGKIAQAVGKVEQSVGERVGSQKLANKAVSIPLARRVAPSAARCASPSPRAPLQGLLALSVSPGQTLLLPRRRSVLQCFSHRRRR
jgi:hypothetical protein